MPESVEVVIESSGTCARIIVDGACAYEVECVGYLTVTDRRPPLVTCPVCSGRGYDCLLGSNCVLCDGRGRVRDG